MNYTDNFYCYKDQESLTLNDDQKQELKDWILDNLFITRSVNKHTSSYGLKHVAESHVGFYVANCDMKKAMVEAGYTPYNTDKINWHFNVSEKSIIAASNKPNIQWRTK